MRRVSICVGSACHLKGAHDILAAFNSLIQKYQAQAIVDMEGCFCQGKCTEGVVIQIDGEVITNVSRERVHQIFIEKILRTGSDQ